MYRLLGIAVFSALLFLPAELVDAQLFRGRLLNRGCCPSQCGPVGCGHAGHICTPGCCESPCLGVWEQNCPTIDPDPDRDDYQMCMDNCQNCPEGLPRNTCHQYCKCKYIDPVGDICFRPFCYPRTMMGQACCPTVGCQASCGGCGPAACCSAGPCGGSCSAGCCHRGCRARGLMRRGCGGCCCR